MLFNYIIEAIPVVLAIIAAISCSHKYGLDRRKQYKQTLLLGVVCAVLLIIAQTSWIVSFLVNDSLAGTWFANSVWTFFNSLTMIAFILLSKGDSTSVEKPIPPRD